MMYLKCVVFYTINIVGIYCSVQNVYGGDDFNWDYLVFSQRWPITSCLQWKDRNNTYKCNLPPYIDIWNIHGVWPTRNDSQGPHSCPSAMHWDPVALQPILDELKIYWVNIEANTKPNSFWAHEWNKHGTCASIVPQMNSVRNYFHEGLELLGQYNMSNILSKGDVVPNDKGYSLETIYTAIKSAINKEPMIECVVDSVSKETMLSEIHICLDKSLELIDCKSHDSAKIISDCGEKKTIMYPNVLPPSFEMDYVDDSLNSLQEYFEKQQHFMMLYRLFKLLMYVTL